MVEKNSFLGNMMDKASGDNQNTPDAKGRQEPAVTQSPYNVEDINIIKLRLIEQRSQLNTMSDYAQDSAIKLNDIYELLNSLQKDDSVTPVKQPQIAFESSLDNFFKVNGYVPVMILNPSGGGSEIDIDMRGGGRGKWSRIFSAVGALAGAMGLAALGGYAIEENVLQPVAPTPVPTPESEPVPGSDIVTGPLFVPPTSAPIGMPENTAPDVIPVPGGLTGSLPIPSNETLVPLMTAIAGMMATLQAMAGRAAGASPVGVGGLGALRRIQPRVGGGGRMFTMPELFHLMSNTESQNDMPFGMRKLTLKADEMIFEADKFEFIQKSIVGSTIPQNSMLTQTAYSPVGTNSGDFSGDATGYSQPNTTTETTTTPGVGGAVSNVMGAVTSVAGSMGPMGDMLTGAATAASAGMNMLSGVLFGDSVTPGMSAGPSDLTTGIIEAANALGMDPIDLATIISYETAGTFDPTKAGPTTRWGQHRGLIQFGEPQAMEYGVDWNNPIGSQLGANGAVVKYFLDNGWRPGMSLLDAYSIVNAGAPGRYDASDTAAGGAPGTVRDKVETQMGPHREKAAALLGESYTPASTSTSAETTGQPNSGNVRPTESSSASGGLIDYLSGLSKNVTMAIEGIVKPTTSPATTVPVSVTNVVSPAYQRVDEPLAAVDKMIDRLLDDMFV
jgi:hypothetical protein